ncbi:hypothetical protein ACWDCO_30800 [Streptomyces albogriseolus]
MPVDDGVFGEQSCQVLRDALEGVVLEAAVQEVGADPGQAVDQVVLAQAWLDAFVRSWCRTTAVVT